MAQSVLLLLDVKFCKIEIMFKQKLKEDMIVFWESNEIFIMSFSTTYCLQYQL